MDAAVVAGCGWGRQGRWRSGSGSSGVYCGDIRVKFVTRTGQFFSMFFQNFEEHVFCSQSRFGYSVAPKYKFVPRGKV
jgi:hypothetical protein